MEHFDIDHNIQTWYNYADWLELVMQKKKKTKSGLI